MIPIQPMLLGRAYEVQNDPRFAFEIKWDGYRSVVEINPRSGVTVWTRHGREITARVPELQSLRGLVRRSCVLDGELVVLDDQGHPVFERMMSSRPHTFIAFDLLRDGNRWITARAWSDRKAKLSQIVVAENAELLVPGFITDGEALLAECERRCIEGVVRKAVASPYRAGERTDDWVKIKTAYGRRITRARMIRSA